MKGRLDRTPLEKMAILLQMLGEETAAKVLKNFPMSEVHKLAKTIKRMEPPEKEEAHTVAKEFLDRLKAGGGLAVRGEDYARSIISRAFDRESAAMLIETLSAPEQGENFQAFRGMDPKVAADFIKGEHPQTLALILAHVDAGLAGRILSQLPEEIRSDVVMRLAHLKDVSPAILKEISEILQTEVAHLGEQGKEIGGLKKVAEILNQTERGVEAEVLKAIQEEDAGLAEGIRQLMFVFNDLIKLDDKAIQEILREVDTKLMAKALRGANEEVREKIFRNMSQRASKVLQEEIEVMGPTRLSEVEEAQMEVTKVAIRLGEEGRIALQSGGEEDVFV